VSSASEKVVQLRQLLAERFHQAPPTEEPFFLTGLPAFDEIGLPRAALTEIVLTSGPGGALLLPALLHAATQRGERIALIDGKDVFQPKSLPPADLDRLLWIRCQTAGEAIKATDLVLRDGNFSLLILLLSLSPIRELGRVPATVWHRLQLVAEKSAGTVLIFSPRAQVGCARLRLSVHGAFPLSRLHSCREELLSTLSLQWERRRRGRERSDK